MWKSPFLLSFLFVMAVALSNTPGAAEVYKWVDENGVVHFTDKPPPQQQATEIDMPEVNAGAQSESIYSEVMERQRARRELRAKKREVEAAEREARQEAEATSESNCARAIHYLNTLSKQCPVFYDGAGYLRAQCPGYYYSFIEGDRTYVDDQEREKLIEHYRRLVDNCNARNR